MGVGEIKEALGKYRFFLFMGLLWLGLYFRKSDLALRSLEVCWYSLKEMVLVIPPIFVLLGLFDAWVPKEQVARFLGRESGFRGVLLSFLAGALAAGPLYGAFPVAAVFLKKNASFKNVFIFVGAWSTMKVPMFLFEGQSLGWRFAVTRLLVNVPGILLIASALSLILKPDEEEWIRRQAEHLSRG